MQFVDEFVTAMGYWGKGTIFLLVTSFNPLSAFMCALLKKLYCTHKL